MKPIEDLENACKFGGYRERRGRIYREWVGSFGGWTLIWDEGKEPERGQIYDDF